MHADTINLKSHRLVASDRVEGKARLQCRRQKNRKHQTIHDRQDQRQRRLRGPLLLGGFLGVGEDYRPSWASMKYNPAIEGYELLTLMTEEELAKAPSFGTDKEFDWGNRVREVDAYWIGF
ncbi:hypothetical protein [Streptomyces griseus]